MDGRVNKLDLARLDALKLEQKLLEDQIKRISRDISECFVSDTVEGSDPEYPYVKHTITVKGFEDDSVHELREELKNARRKLRRHQVKCVKTYNQAINYIYDIDDALIRAIFILKYIEKKTWNDIAANIGGSNTPDSLRKMHDRYLCLQKGKR